MIRVQLQVMASDLRYARSLLAEQAKGFFGVTPFTLESVEVTPAVTAGDGRIVTWRVDAIAEVEA